MLFFHDLLNFWTARPALFYGLAFLLGFYAVLQSIGLALFSLVILWAPLLFSIRKAESRSLRRLALSLALFLTSSAYGIYHYQFPPLPLEGLSGTALIAIRSLSSSSTPFGKIWLYQCRLIQFLPDATSDSIVKQVNCAISIPQTTEIRRPLANSDYLVQGTLQKTATGGYRLKIKKRSPWKIVKSSWNLSEARFKAKQKVKSFIRARISHQKSAIFLSGILTGEFDDRLMQDQFSRFGLQHIMAISGFHFALAASFLHFFFRCFFSQKTSVFCLLFFLSAYFLFLGYNASILRAWSMISLALIGQLIGKPVDALNLAGASLFVVLGFDPLLCGTLGFQFSFLVTTAILLLYSPIENYLGYLLLKRPLSQVVEMNKWNQHGYYFLSLFRQGLALSIAVNLFALPLTLYYFHQFPYLSVLYNLFFPFLVSLSLFLLMSGLLSLILCPPLEFFFHLLNNAYTKWTLSLTSNMPPALDLYCKAETFPSWLLVAYLCAMGLVGVYIKNRHSQKEDAPFPFI